MDKRSSLEALEKRQATKSKKFESIKAKIRANKGKKPNRARVEVREMAYEYEQALNDYNGKPTKTFKTNIEEGTRSWTLLSRAVGFAKELGIDARTYVKGLFYIHDKWWNKHPNTREISDYKTKIPAKERVARYLAEVASGEAVDAKKVVGPVSTKVIKIPQSSKSLQSERQLKAFMSNYSMSEEEVFLEFAQGTSALMYFDAKWLVSNETYTRLKEEGRI